MESERLLTSYSVQDIYIPDKHLEAVNVMGADDNAHPAVSYLHNKTKDLYVGGKIEAIQAPNHFDYVPLRCKFVRQAGRLWQELG